MALEFLATAFLAVAFLCAAVMIVPMRDINPNGFNTAGAEVRSRIGRLIHLTA